MSLSPGKGFLLLGCGHLAMTVKEYSSIANSRISSPRDWYNFEVTFLDHEKSKQFGGSDEH